MNHSIKNSVQITGILGKDVILTSFGNGNKKATILMATNNVEESTKTVWRKIIAWGRMAEDLAANISKGSLLKIFVKINQKKHTYVTGVSKNTLEFVMTDYIKLSSKQKPTIESSSF